MLYCNCMYVHISVDALRQYEQLNVTLFVSSCQQTFDLQGGVYWFKLLVARLGLATEIVNHNCIALCYSVTSL